MHTSSTESKYLQLYMGVLVLVSLVASYALACVTPFVALAVVAALTLPRNQGLMFILAAWVGNQAIGYGVLDYPVDSYSIGWGIVIGLAALAAFTAATIINQSLAKTHALLRMSLVFLAATASNQLFMFAAALTPLGGLSGFSFDIIMQVIGINFIAFIAMLTAKLTAVSLGLLPSKSNAFA